jgi:hypothetical protein
MSETKTTGTESFSLNKPFLEENGGTQCIARLGLMGAGQCG